LERWAGQPVARLSPRRTRATNPLPDFVERAYAAEIAAAGASDGRRQVLGRLVVALGRAGLHRDIA